MATVSGPPAGVTRNKSIQPRLKTILSDAADACGIDHVRISSGGQDQKGKGTRRTGSTRHDNGNAADLELLVGGRVLNFDTNDRDLVSRFVTECSRRGATGIGAGGKPGSGSYMGPTKLHIGFGTPSTWGGNKARSADAPQWLRAAVAASRHPNATTEVLRKGDSGPAVVKLQQALAKHGRSINLKVDGDFGTATEAAVKAFQRANGLVVDGIAGPRTLAALGL